MFQLYILQKAIVIKSHRTAGGGGGGEERQYPSPPPFRWEFDQGEGGWGEGGDGVRGRVVIIIFTIVSLS